MQGDNGVSSCQISLAKAQLRNRWGCRLHILHIGEWGHPLIPNCGLIALTRQTWLGRLLLLLFENTTKTRKGMERDAKQKNLSTETSTCSYPIIPLIVVKWMALQGCKYIPWHIHTLHWTPGPRQDQHFVASSTVPDPNVFKLKLWKPIVLYPLVTILLTSQEEKHGNTLISIAN